VNIRRLRLVAAAVVSMALAVPGTALAATSGGPTASPSSGQTVTSASGENCVVVVAPLQPHQTASRVISRTCSDRPVKGSDLSLGSSAASLYPIIAFWQYTNYTGGRLLFEGTQPCSPSNGGYGFPDTRPPDYGAPWGASSWRAYSSCWHTTLYYGYEYGQPGYVYPQGVWEAGVIGSGLDNHVWSAYTSYT
jgi:hypothetical protein